MALTVTIQLKICVYILVDRALIFIIVRMILSTKIEEEISNACSVLTIFWSAGRARSLNLSTKKRQKPWVFCQFFMVATELSAELYKYQILEVF